MKKYITALSMMLALSAVLCGCSGGRAQPRFYEGVFAKAQYGAADVTETDAGFTVENDYLKLVFLKEDCAFFVEDKRSGKTVSSVVDADVIKNMRTSNLQKELMGSVLTVNYAAKNTSYVKTIKTTCFKTPGEKAKASYKAVENGVRADITFTKTGISLSLAVTLEDDAFKAEIPSDSIKETKSNGLLNVDMLPFLGCTTAEDDGYFVYPDGSGAIFEFSDAKRLSASALKKYTFPLYSKDLSALPEDDRHWYVDNETERQCAVPVFGISRKDGGILAVIEDGDSDAVINVSPSGAIVSFNQIYPSFVYRRLFDVRRSKTSVGGTAQKQENNIKKIQQDYIATDRSVRYRLLAGDDCGYSRMAAEYRSMLIAEGRLPEKMPDTAQPFAADIFMAALEKRFPFDKYIRMTTFGQSGGIYDALRESGIQNIYFNLSGQSKNGMGVYPQPAGTDRRLGTGKDIAALSQNVKKTGGKLFFQHNILDIDNASGFSVRGSAVTLGNGTALTDDSAGKYLYSAGAAAERFNSKLLGSVPNGAGISFERLGELVYNDYGAEGARKSDTANIFRGVLKTARENGLSVGVYGANMYAYDLADILYDVPDSDTGYRISSRAVPFLQMILHGSIPYTGEPVNLSGNVQRAVLRMLEYGYTPYFKLTYESSERLIFTDFNYLYSTEYTRWLDKAKEIYGLFDSALDGIYRESITEHGIVADDVVSVTYGDRRIIINYGDEPYTGGTYTVDACGFTVIDEGSDGNER